MACKGSMHTFTLIVYSHKLHIFVYYDSSVRTRYTVITFERHSTYICILYSYSMHAIHSGFPCFLTNCILTAPCYSRHSWSQGSQEGNNVLHHPQGHKWSEVQKGTYRARLDESYRWAQSLGSLNVDNAILLYSAYIVYIYSSLFFFHSHLHSVPPDALSRVMESIPSTSEGDIRFHRRGEPYYEFHPSFLVTLRVGDHTYESCEDYLVAQMSARTDVKTKYSWRCASIGAMEEALYVKFTQHEELLLMLLATATRNIIYHHKSDDLWGDGGYGEGQNQLGVLLMGLRKSFMKPFEHSC